MKKQDKSRWRSLATTMAAVVLMFAASSPTFAQTTYKVGDRVEVLTAGIWSKGEIAGVKDNGEYLILFWGTVSPYPAKSIRPLKADSLTGTRGDTANQTEKQPTVKAQTTAGGTGARQEKKLNERYGSREPRTCDDVKAPAQGAITAGHALKYLNCQMEGVSGGKLYLVENVKVEVGGGVPYDPTLGAWEAIDVSVPLYPIRGSYLGYQCSDLVREHVGPPDTNCATYNNPKAKGYCYKTTFRDWQCHMADGGATDAENARRKVAPPKP